MRLTVVIPALNEEEAIAATIERCLAARRHIARNSPVERVDIIVVSDGSTDRTAQIAAGYDEVRLIVFEKNRGYGAAIKRGFEEAAEISWVSWMPMAPAIRVFLLTFAGPSWRRTRKWPSARAWVHKVGCRRSAVWATACMQPFWAC